MADAEEVGFVPSEREHVGLLPVGELRGIVRPQMGHGWTRMGREYGKGSRNLFEGVKCGQKEASEAQPEARIVCGVVAACDGNCDAVGLQLLAGWPQRLTTRENSRGLPIRELHLAGGRADLVWSNGLVRGQLGGDARAIRAFHAIVAWIDTRDASASVHHRGDMGATQSDPSGCLRSMWI